MSIQFVIAGTGPVKVKNERKIVNFNLSHIVLFSFLNSKIAFPKYFIGQGTSRLCKSNFTRLLEEF